MISTDSQVRIHFPGVLHDDDFNLNLDVTIDVNGDRPETRTVIAAKEWSITEDILTVSDSACVSIANIDGEHSGVFKSGQLCYVEESDPNVANGAWVRHFTGRVTAVDTYADVNGGDCIAISMMDLGWHVVNCHSVAHGTFSGKSFDFESATFKKLMQILIDPSWGIDLDKITFNGDQMTKIRQGRLAQVRELARTHGQIVPHIQVEVGQTPFDILSMYAQREGLLLNIDSNGQLVFFKPNYKQDAHYTLHYHAVSDPDRTKNNVVGRPSVRESIDGMYTETRCWSTKVNEDEQIGDNSNEMFLKTPYNPPGDKILPFNRRCEFSDSEAITKRYCENRAILKYQTGLFESWEYTVEFQGHVQGNLFFTSNSLIDMKDTVHKIDGIFYVQRVQRSSTVSGGNRTKLTIRRPNLLDPDLGSIVPTKQAGGTHTKSASAPKATRPLKPVYATTGSGGTFQIGYNEKGGTYTTDQVNNNPALAGSIKRTPNG